VRGGDRRDDVEPECVARGRIERRVAALGLAGEHGDRDRLLVAAAGAGERPTLVEIDRERAIDLRGHRAGGAARGGAAVAVVA
jgi:hypothetical protein